MLEAAGEEERDRLDNLDEFKSSIIEYVSNNDEPTLTGFLEENALVADVDRYDESADAVVMMTIHSAKGLEFPIVIIPGFEDGIFPGIQNIVGNAEDMEEERRLAYVALTRAKEQVYILHTKSRLLYGQTQYNPVSRFVTEIPERYVEKEEPFAPWEADLKGGSRPKVYIQNGVATGVKSRGYSAPKSPWDTPVSQPKITPAKPIFEKKEGTAVQFVPGDRVIHMTFGEGEVLSVRPMGADTHYEVMFDKVGIKKLMASYAKLKKK
jgi:DNA helicase-2/ATP-dependent DNA helicase PcrA